MDSTVRQKIEELASLVRIYCNMGNSIQSEENIVASLGGRLENVERAAAGCTVRKCTDEPGVKFEVCLAGNLDTKERRLALFRALGHLFLHMGFMIDEDMWKRAGSYQKSGSSEESCEADEFALDILMPAHDYRTTLINSRSKEENTVDIRKISDHFKVPAGAVVDRGRRLGYLEW